MNIQNWEERVRKESASQAINRTLSDIAETLGIDVPPGTTPTERRNRMIEILQGMLRVRGHVLDIEITGTLEERCGSVYRSESYAAYCTFALQSRARVLIFLCSDDLDPYLFLLPGKEINAEPISYNDDLPEEMQNIDFDPPFNDTDSFIGETLEAGTYTIEATTYEEGTGTFRLYLYAISTEE